MGFFCANREQHSTMCALKLPESDEHNKSQVRTTKEKDRRWFFAKCRKIVNGSSHDMD
jgi:hypothetical protein